MGMQGSAGQSYKYTEPMTIIQTGITMVIEQALREKNEKVKMS